MLMHRNKQIILQKQEEFEDTKGVIRIRISIRLDLDWIYCV